MLNNMSMAELSPCQLQEFWDAMYNLAARLGVAPMNRHPGLWKCQLNDCLCLETNGHYDTIDGVQPFTVRVTCNGFPVGLLDPFFGIITKGAGANIQSLIAAMNDRGK